MRTLALLLISAISLGSSSAFAASYQQRDGTIVDPIQDIFGGNLGYSESNLEPLANLSIADLTNADLTNADLTGASLFSADLTNADLTNADLSCANLSCANLASANLSNANLSFADLFGADLSFANMSSANLTGVASGGIRITFGLPSLPPEWTFANGYLVGPTANLRGAPLRVVDLSFANMIATDLSFADLTATDLTNADLTNADLIAADLSGANLTFANLTNADLTYATLLLADLTNATLSGAFYDQNTIFPYGLDIYAGDWGLPTDATPWDLGMVPVPEPASGIMLAVGGLVLAAMGRRR